MKYFININLGAMGPKAQGNKPPALPPVSTKKWGHMFPQFERWYIESINAATGTYNLINKDSSNRMRGVINIAPRPGIPAIGDIANVGFYDCSRQKPYIWEIGNAVSSTTPIADRFFEWLRFGVRMLHRHFASDWDDTEDLDSFITLTVPTGFAGPGVILRTDADGIVYWVDGNFLKTKDLTTGGVDSTNLDGEITSMCLGETTGRSYCTVSAFVDASEGECAEGYAAGEAAAELSNGFGQGSADCTDEAGQNDVIYGEQQLELFFPPPEEESEEWKSCYNDGFLAMYTELYRQGYENEGCTWEE